MFILRINSDSAVVYANKLEKLHRSALPIVVRQTLSKAAFDTKKIHLERVTDQLFPKRQKNFFKFFSRAEAAKGFNISTMQSRVGISPKGNIAAENLRLMERGGVIKDREFLPTIQSRTSGNKDKLVSRANKLAILKAKNRATRVAPGNARRYIKAAIKAGKGGTVIYGDTMLKISSIERRGSNTFIKAKAIYTFQRGRNVNVSGTGFMKKSSNLAAKNITNTFNKLAKKRINKVLRT